MAICPKCGNTSFAAEIISAENLNFNIAAIKCKSCSTVVGVIDLATADRIYQIEKKLKSIG